MSIIRGDVRPAPRCHTVHGLFEELLTTELGGKPVAKRRAVTHDDVTVTFEQLNERANQIARSLLSSWEENGVDLKNTRRRIVGIFMGPSIDRVATILAVFKLGAAYVPLDPILPIERLKYIFQETKILCVVVSSDNVAIINNADLLEKNLRVYECNMLYSPATESSTSGNLDLSEIDAVEENPLLCVLYTSGSTGLPKGVRLRHRNLLNRLNWQWVDLPIQPAEIGCHKTSLLFVDSLTEIFGCLLKGAPIVIMPKSTTQNPELFVQELERYNITRLVLVPSLLRNIFLYLKFESTNDGNQRLPNLKLVVSSGETLPIDLFTAVLPIFPRWTHFGKLLRKYRDHW